MFRMMDCTNQKDLDSAPALRALNTGTLVELQKKPRLPTLKRSSYHSHSAALLGSPRKESSIIEKPEQDEAMATCFLQYCAMCERQIATPSNSILYCSEACQRKDGKKPLSAANLMEKPYSFPSPPSSARPILQPRVPTGLNTATDVPGIRIPQDQHSFTSDLDPTEWKPKPTGASRPVVDRYNSEAFRYLSSFHRAIAKAENGSDSDALGGFVNGGRELSSITPVTPSLGNTPSSVSNWSISTSAGYPGSSAIDFHTRPTMPFRHNRWYSTSVMSTMGDDLVTPHVAPSADPYVRTAIPASATPSKGGLGTFFGSH